MGRASIMRQLWMLTMFLVGIITFLGCFTFWRSSAIYQALDDTAHKQLPAIHYSTLADMLHDGLRAVVVETLYRAQKKEMNKLPELAKEKDEKIKDFHSHIDKLASLNLSDKTLKVILDIRPSLKNYTDICSEVVDMAASGKLTEAEALMPKFEESFDELEKRMGALSNEIEHEAGTFSTAGSNTLYTIGALTFAGIILGFFFSLFALRNLRKYVENFLDEVLRTSGSISSVSERLSTANNQFSSSATEAASSLQETVASLDQLSSMVTLNTESAQRASSVSIHGRESAEKGEKEIQDLSSAMNAIKQSSKKMEEIINVIDEIAFQTNLLALNAAVEAARAGEQGRGFAVVAEAVRSLAQRSSSAAKDISTMIKESIHKIDSGGRIVDSSREALNTIFNSIKEVSDLNHQIATASTEQSTGIKQISQAMNQLDSASQQNATGAQEVSLISDQMFHESTRLKTLVTSLNQRFLGTRNQTSPSGQGGIVINLEDAVQAKPLFQADKNQRKISNLNDF